MAQSHLMGASAQIFAHPNLFAPPVQQGRRKGRHPNSIASLWRVRSDKRIAAREAQLQVDRINAYKCAIAEAEGYVRGCRLTLSELMNAAVSNKKGATNV